MNSGLLYEDAVHHNCVFVGRDESGQAKYAGLRGTYDLDSPGFKGDATGSDKTQDSPSRTIRAQIWCLSLRRPLT